MYDEVLEIGFRLKRTVMRWNYPDKRASFLRRLVVMYDVVLEIGFRLKRTVMRRNSPDCRAS